jgi:hypothetical protein
MADFLPIYLMGGAIGFLLGLLPLIGFVWKVPESRFYAMARLSKNIVVRVHHADERERWYRGVVGPSGLVINDAKTGEMLVINPDKLAKGKAGFSMGLDYVDVGTNSYWPVGSHEGLYVDLIDTYIDDRENHCDFLRSREQLERHALLNATKVNLPSKIRPLLNIDPALVKIDPTGKTDDQIKTALLTEYERIVWEEIQKIIDEITRVKTALEGRVVLDSTFSWSNACFAINSQLQPEIVKKFDAVLKRLAFDDDKAEDKRWNRIYILLICFGAVCVAIIGGYKLLFG